jgi:hypothetical protein
LPQLKISTVNIIDEVIALIDLNIKTNINGKGIIYTTDFKSSKTS